jgi:hypothetical protein
MPRRVAVIPTILVALISTVVGVAEAKKPKYIESHFLTLDPADQSPVTKNGVTIAVDPGASTADPKYFIEYISPTQKDWLGNPVKKRDNMFAGLIVIEVAITNNTGHVLRTNGAAVSLTPGDGGEPVQPFTLVALNQAWAQAGVAGLDAYMKTNKIRLVTLESDVILPGQTLKGLMPFQAKIEGIKSCTLSMLDLVTQTDAAGNPTERTTFTFNMKENVTQIEQK